MPKITLGNTKIIEKTVLKNVFTRQELSISSVNKRFTRHYVNTIFYLNPTEKALFDWLIYYSTNDSSFEYSTKLLQTFSDAADKAIEIYQPNKVLFNTSLYNVRKAMIVLIEKGLLIRLTVGSNMFMVNPYIVFSHNKRWFLYNRIHAKYLEIMNNNSIDKLSNELTSLCDEIYHLYKKHELERRVKK